MSSPENRWGLWLIAGVVPLAIGVSLPSLFTMAAIGIVAVHGLFKKRSAAIGVPLAAFVVATGTSVGLMAAFGQYRVSPDDRAYFLKFWAGAFPPSVLDPGALWRWLCRMASGPLFAFPHGGDLRLAWLTPVVFGCFAIGAAILLRQRGRRGLAILLALPILLTLAAAALQRYPFGLSARVNLYLVPAVLILAASGMSWIWSRIPNIVVRRGIVIACGCFLALFAVCKLGSDLGHPYRAPWDRTGREFARWFWEEMSVTGEVVCVRSDLGISFGPKRWCYDGADQYLCYQRIYSPRHREGGSPRWDRISAGHPLRCVLLSRRPEEVPDFANWIEQHRDRYTLKAVQRYPATRGSAVEPALVYVVCEFVPNEGVMASGERTKLR
jgi:hypothetical protein